MAVCTGFWEADCRIALLKVVSKGAEVGGGNDEDPSSIWIFGTSA
jgi:hypothetical protein